RTTCGQDNDTCLAIAQYRDDGTPDAALGNGSGRATSAFLGTSGGGSINDIGTDADGRLLVAGDDGHHGLDFFIGRYSPDGQLDDSFGDGGFASADFGTTRDSAQTLAFAPDGK